MTESSSSGGSESRLTRLDDSKYLSFFLDGCRYGIDILRVQEIIGITKITPVPGAADYIRGVLNLRGKIIPAIDLRRKFEIESKKDDAETCIIVITNPSQNSLIGFIVDTVIDVVPFKSSEIQEAPDQLVSDDVHYIKGIGIQSDRPVSLVDIDKVIKSCERV